MSEKPELPIPEHKLGRVGWASVPICAPCYRKLYRRVPLRTADPPVEVCYQCLLPTQSGIYTRGYAKVVLLHVTGLGLWPIYERYPN